MEYTLVWDAYGISNFKLYETWNKVTILCTWAMISRFVAVFGRGSSSSLERPYWNSNIHRCIVGNQGLDSFNTINFLVWISVADKRSKKLWKVQFKWLVNSELIDRSMDNEFWFLYCLIAVFLNSENWCLTHWLKLCGTVVFVLIDLITYCKSNVAEVERVNQDSYQSMGCPKFFFIFFHCVFI